MDIKVKTTAEGQRLRREVSRLSAIANKRINRLILRGYTDSPAFQAWESGGSIKFGVRGKSQREVEKEYIRVKNFLNSRTSTVRGVHQHIRNVASAMGLHDPDIHKLHDEISIIWKLEEKISEYDKSLGEAARALDYRRIINEIKSMKEKDDQILLETAHAKDQIAAMENLIDQFIKAFRN